MSTCLLPDNEKRSIEWYLYSFNDKCHASSSSRTSLRCVVAVQDISQAYYSSDYSLGLWSANISIVIVQGTIS